MEKTDNIELRSAAFREILGTTPSWIVQFGTVIAVLGLFIVGLFSYFFTYPDIVKASIKISTAEPPQSVISPRHGVLDNLVSEQSTVEQGEVLAVLREDGAKVSDIKILEETVKGLEDFEEEFVEFEQDKSLQLGSVEAAYLSFVELHKQYKLTRVSQFHDREIDRLNEKMDDLNLEIEERSEDINEIQDEIDDLKGPIKDKYQKLLGDAKSDPAAYQAAYQAQQDRIQTVNRLEREQDQIGQQIRDKKREIEDIGVRKLEIRQGWKNNSSSAGSDFRNQIIELKEAVRKWKEEHLILAPSSGTVYYSDDLKARDYIARSDTRILSIVPTDAEKTLKGKLFISTADAIKVQKGQQVNIRFEAYPVSTYGLLEGEVSDKTAIANKDGKKMITVDIEKLKTSNGKVLPFEHDMQGFAHIITEERPLLFRFFDYFLR